MPALGEAHFNIVAEASEEFDRYLRETQKGTEDLIAHRKGIRTDKFPTRESQKVIPTETKSDQRRLNVKSKRPQINAESDIAETESEESESECDEDFEMHKGKGNGSTPVEVPSNVKTSSIEKPDEDDAAKEYAEFLRFREMSKGKK